VAAGMMQILQITRWPVLTLEFTGWFDVTGMDVVVQIEDPQQPGRNLYETARVLALMHHPLDRYNVQVAIEWYSGYEELQRLNIVDVEEEWRQAKCRWLEPLYPTI